MSRPWGSNPCKRWFHDVSAAWDRFWFSPRRPHTLGLLRIATGAMLLYTHLVLATDLWSFLGTDAWIDNQTAHGLHRGAFDATDWGISYLWAIDSPTWLWLHQLVTILVTLAFAVGLFTRITAPLAWFLQLMYMHRLTGTLFGLDQVTTMLAMYLMLAPCGAVFSVDAVLRRWRKAAAEGHFLRRLPAWLFPDDGPSVAANVATRLGQLHLCVIYLFGGLWKARGEMWWDGSALWFAVSNLEYQSLDIAWLAARYPRVTSALTNVTVFWEIFYCALVWPRLTRPLVLAMAVAVHGGIAIALGMITFGTMMIVANAIFLSPEWVRSWQQRGLPKEASPAAALSS